MRAGLGGLYLLEGAGDALAAVQVITGHLCKAKTPVSGRSSQVTGARVHPQRPSHSLSFQVLRNGPEVQLDLKWGGAG